MYTYPITFICLISTLFFRMSSDTNTLKTLSGSSSEHSSHVKRMLSNSSEEEDGDLMPPYTQSDSTSASTIYFDYRGY